MQVFDPVNVAKYVGFIKVRDKKRTVSAVQKEQFLFKIFDPGLYDLSKGKGLGISLILFRYLVQLMNESVIILQRFFRPVQAVVQD